MNSEDGMKYVMRNWNRQGIKIKGITGQAGGDVSEIRFWISCWHGNLGRSQRLSTFYISIRDRKNTESANS